MSLGILTEDEYKNGLRQLPVNNAVGFEQAIDTLTQIVSKVQRQKYYQLLGQSLTDFVPIEMGFGGYSGQIFQFQVANVGDGFEAGVVSPGNGVNKDANVDIQVDGVTIKNNFWRCKYTVTKEILEMARVNAQNFSYIEEQETARLKTYQLGIQKVAFLGTDDGLNKGLLNQSTVTVDTTLLAKDIKDMNYTELNAFAKSAIAVYLANNNTTVMPNRWLMPTSDFVALAGQFNPQYPNFSTKTILEDAFKSIAGADFKIVHATYCDNAGTAGARHVLYNCDADSLTMYLPRAYTPHPLYPAGALDLVSVAEAQFTGVWAKRPKEILYMDVTSST